MSDRNIVLVLPERIIPLDRARTFITFLVVLYHAAINYTYYGIGGDHMHWLGFDLLVLFCDSFFMTCMFFISGLFVYRSLVRRGSLNFLTHRVWRLGLPFLVSIFVLMPIAYYRYYVSQFGFAEFYWQMMGRGPWSAGSSWFLWVLLVLDAIAAVLFVVAPATFRMAGHCVTALCQKPIAAFAAFAIFSIAIYLPLRLVFGDTSWLAPGHYPLPIQTSRILLYAGYFFCGVAVGATGLKAAALAESSAFAERWAVWLVAALACYAGIVFLVYVHRGGLIDLNSPPLWWHAAYGSVFAMFSAAMTFAVPAAFLRFARSSFGLLDAMQPSAYGIYLLHFIPLIWLQYLVYDTLLNAIAKFAIVFVGTLSVSWALTLLLRKNHLIARMI